MAQYKNSGIRLDGEAADRSLTGIATSRVSWNAATTNLDSYNVSSLTDNGTGDTTVTYTAGMNATHYSYATGTLQTGLTARGSSGLTVKNGTVPTAASINVVHHYGSTASADGTLSDSGSNSVTTYGDLA
jgi:hypothetical protein